MGADRLLHFALERQRGDALLIEAFRSIPRIFAGLRGHRKGNARPFRDGDPCEPIVGVVELVSIASQGREPEGRV